MKKIILSTLVASSLLVASEYKYEVTPIVGYVDTKEHVDLDNQKVAGFSISKNMDEDCKLDQIELGLLHSLGDADYEDSVKDSAVARVFVNGLKDFDISTKFKFYGLVGLGYEGIKNEQYHNDSGAFFNYGLGIKYAITDSLSLRVGASHILKFDGDRDVLYTVGLSIPFGAKSVDAPTVKPAKQELVIEQDDDKDGVVNSKDMCPATLSDVKVDKNGCEVDDDKDGVVNSKDLCPTTKEGVKVDENGCKPLDKPEELGVLFEVNSDQIKSSDLSKFDKYVNYVQKVPTVIIILEAHTDSDGDANYNMDLSQRRANSVKAQLVKMGVDENRIKAIGYGESKPLVANDTVEHKQMNRRVTARIKTK